MSNLEEEVKQLKEQVSRLQKMLAVTGQQVMELQMYKHKQQIDDIGTKTQDLQAMVPAAASTAAGGARKSDYVTESDLGDMVVELQEQLTLIDQRNIRRLLNSRSSSKLVSLPNSDGEHNPNFPASIEDLQRMSDQEVFDQWNHFEMLPNGETLDDLLDKEETEAAKEGNQKLLNEIYDALLQYLGLDPEKHPRKS